MNSEDISNEKEIFSKSTLMFTLLTFLFSLAIAVSEVTPPHAKPQNSPATEFSAYRAYKSLQVIAQNVHYTGTVENQEVREYIIKTLNGIGLKPTVQEKAFSGVKNWGHLDVKNIICYIKGTNSKNSSLMLVAHYDSMPTGPGAMDDGSGVATLLETARAIKAGKPLKNDVILLFTDGEEPGLLGAQAFIEDNKSLISEIALIANFDAGGTKGPAVLTETNNGNEYITQKFLNKVSENTAFSSLVDLSRFFTSNTDIRVLEKTGVSYINIIVCMNKEKIHTAKDNLKDFSIDTLQQQGNYALAFCKEFGSLDNLSSKVNSKRDNIFFPVSKWFSVMYGQNWGIFLALITTIFYIAIVFVGLKSKKLSLKDIFSGSIVFLSGILSSGIISFSIISLSRLAFKSRVDPFFRYEVFLRGSGFTNILILGLILFSISIMSFIFCKVNRKITFIDLFSGVLLIWCIAVLISGLYFKGLSYMFVWPFVFALLVQGYHICINKCKSCVIANLVVAFFIIAPVVILVFPIAYISTSAGLDKVPFIIMIISMSFGIIAPYLHDKLGKRSWMVYAFSGTSGIIFMLLGILGFAIWMT